MKNLIFSIIIASISNLSYSQTTNKIRIEHIGEIDKPFPTLELYNSEGINTTEKKNTVTVTDSIVFIKTLKYFDEKYVGKVDSSEASYGTFSIFFYDNDKLLSKVFLNKEGAVYFFVNLHTFMMLNEKNKNIIYGIVRRLL